MNTQNNTIAPVWRLLEPGEITQIGDEYRPDCRRPWKALLPADLGQAIDETSLSVRRRLGPDPVKAELLAALEEAIGYIEMRLAHTGAQSVDEVMGRLADVRKYTASIETAHHLGCSQTTRRADLERSRNLISRAKSPA